MSRPTLRPRRTLLGVLTGATALALVAAGPATAGSAAPPDTRTATPIRHVVVLFDENNSFDHYFGTYPKAANPAGEPAFHAKAGTPKVNGLTPWLLNHNPNLANPMRLDRSQALTCDQDHAYSAEQKAFDHGRMDQFVQNTEVVSCPPPELSLPGLVMDYYDGNTVTALWNYAQRFALSDNFYGTTFGPSTPGALNLVSGQTWGGTARDAAGNAVSDSFAVVHPNGNLVGTLINDPDPYYDDCSNPAFNHVSMQGRNVGDLLNAKGVSWGWFQGGFRPTAPATATSKAVCASAHPNIGGAVITDYSAHHEPFQYYASTANPHHVPPASLAEIGHAGPANHQYDLTDFSAALSGGNLPAVSFLKAASYQDGHAGYSDPLDEQQFLVNAVNSIESSRYWHDTAIVIAYDDSDGWYDHKASPIVNSSHDPQYDFLDGVGNCGDGVRTLRGYQDRCGHGPRLPLLVLSPYSKVNAVDHNVIDQTSVLRFIEENWGLGRIGGGSFDRLVGSLDGLFDWSNPTRWKLFLDPVTGERVG
jgi:phospholipase C